MPAPYLRRISLDPGRVPNPGAYPFCLPFLRGGFELEFEPESALSPSRQIEFLKLLRRMEQSGIAQVIRATHAPPLMAYPGASLLRLTKGGLEPTTVEQTDHYRLMRAFFAGPKAFIETMLDG